MCDINSPLNLQEILNGPNVVCVYIYKWNLLLVDSKKRQPCMTQIMLHPKRTDPKFIIIITCNSCYHFEMIVLSGSVQLLSEYILKAFIFFLSV